VLSQLWTIRRRSTRAVMRATGSAARLRGVFTTRAADAHSTNEPGSGPI
jgi:hypothetical protein